MANTVNGGSHSSIESLNGEFRRHTKRVLECNLWLRQNNIRIIWRLFTILYLFLHSHRLVGKAWRLIQKWQRGTAFSSHFRGWCDGRFTCRSCRGTIETGLEVRRSAVLGLWTGLWPITAHYVLTERLILSLFVLDWLGWLDIFVKTHLVARKARLAHQENNARLVFCERYVLVVAN